MEGGGRKTRRIWGPRSQELEKEEVGAQGEVLLRIETDLVFDKEEATGDLPGTVEGQVGTGT